MLHFKVDMWIEMSSGHECRNLSRHFCRSNFWFRLLGLGFRLFISLSEYVSESRKTHLAVNSEMSDQGMLAGRCFFRFFSPQDAYALESVLPHWLSSVCFLFWLPDNFFTSCFWLDMEFQLFVWTYRGWLEARVPGIITLSSFYMFSFMAVISVCGFCG